MVAGQYATLAGVLAGFAFAGLVLVLTHRLSSQDGGHPKGPNRTDDSLLLMIAAFISLSLTALAYSLISGEVAAQGRAANEHVVAGGNYAAAAMVLLLAILELVVAVAPTVERWTRILVAACAPTVLLTYVGAGVLQAYAINCAPFQQCRAVGFLVRDRTNTDRGRRRHPSRCRILVSYGLPGDRGNCCCSMCPRGWLCRGNDLS